MCCAANEDRSFCVLEAALRQVMAFTESRYGPRSSGRAKVVHDLIDTLSPSS